MTLHIMFWPPLDVRYMRIYLTTPHFYWSYFIFGIAIAPGELCTQNAGILVALVYNCNLSNMIILQYMGCCNWGYPSETHLNTLRPRQNGRHFADDIFKCIFLNENVRIAIKISLKFVPKDPINNIPALVQIMAWRRPGDKPLSEPMRVSLLTHIYVTPPQWVKLKSSRIVSLHNSYLHCSVLLKFHANHRSITVMFYAKFQNDWCAEK